MKVVRTSNPDIKLIKINDYPDEREMRNSCIVTYQWNVLRQYVDKEALPFISEAETHVKRAYTLRGMYYDRPPRAGAILVRCLRGKAYVVAVDLRDNKPTYRKWVGKPLTEKNGLQMYIPQGFAHGFLTLEDDTVLQYKSTSYVGDQFRRIINHADPLLGINWQAKPVYMSVQAKFAPGIEQVELEKELEVMEDAYGDISDILEDTSTLLEDNTDDLTDNPDTEGVSASSWDDTAGVAGALSTETTAEE